MEKIGIHTEFIQLDQLLKWANIIDTGGQVKLLLEEKRIFINDVLCTEKRKKIYPQDIVTIKGHASFMVVTEEE